MGGALSSGAGDARGEPPAPPVQNSPPPPAPKRPAAASPKRPSAGAKKARPGSEPRGRAPGRVSSPSAGRSPPPRRAAPPSPAPAGGADGSKSALQGAVAALFRGPPHPPLLAAATCKQVHAALNARGFAVGSTYVTAALNEMAGAGTLRVRVLSLGSDHNARLYGPTQAAVDGEAERRKAAHAAERARAQAAAGLSGAGLRDAVAALFSASASHPSIGAATPRDVLNALRARGMAVGGPWPAESTSKALLNLYKAGRISRANVGRTAKVYALRQGEADRAAARLVKEADAE